jgi:hypothetical protein
MNRRRLTEVLNRAHVHANARPKSNVRVQRYAKLLGLWLAPRRRANEAATGVPSWKAVQS